VFDTVAGVEETTLDRDKGIVVLAGEKISTSCTGSCSRKKESHLFRNPLPCP